MILFCFADQDLTKSFIPSICHYNPQMYIPNQGRVGMYIIIRIAGSGVSYQSLEFMINLWNQNSWNAGTSCIVMSIWILYLSIIAFHSLRSERLIILFSQFISNDQYYRFEIIVGIFTLFIAYSMQINRYIYRKACVNWHSFRWRIPKHV